MSQPDPRQHDEKTAALYLGQAEAGRKVRTELDRVHAAAGDARKTAREGRAWQMTDSAALGRTTPVARLRFEMAAREARILDSEVREMNAIYGAWLWNRYFLVTNAGGHVHRDMSCSTCFPTTEYAWLPELSGCDEAEMITEFGEKACTVCFPGAPASPAYHAPGRRDRAAQEVRQAEKDARAAEKAARSLTRGQQFRDADGWLITTVSAAVKVLRNEVEARYWYPVAYARGSYAEASASARQVLLAREAAQPGTGKTQAQIDQIVAAAEKKNAKDKARAEAAR